MSKEMRKYIDACKRVMLNEEENLKPENNNLVDFDAFPKDVLETLKSEYGSYYLHNFDWNSKQDEFLKRPEEFRIWLKRNESDEFLKNLDILIQKTRQDLILLIRKRNAEKVLKSFEELIIPAIGNEILVEPLSKYMETALLYLNDIKEIEQAFKDAQNIINSDGSINQSKIIPSTLFVGGEINLPNFERFVEKNPEYTGVFNDWKKLLDIEFELSMTDLNAFRSSTPYQKIKYLYDFLVSFRNRR